MGRLVRVVLPGRAAVGLRGRPALLDLAKVLGTASTAARRFGPRKEWLAQPYAPDVASTAQLHHRRSVLAVHRWTHLSAYTVDYVVRSGKGERGGVAPRGAFAPCSCRPVPVTLSTPCLSGSGQGRSNGTVARTRDQS